MQALRNATFLARLALAWFVLALGIAAAAPALQPLDLRQVCSEGTAKLLLASDEDSHEHHGLDCPLCLSSAPPPALFAALRGGDAPPGAVAGPIITRTVRSAGAPLPARGPPVTLVLS